MTATDLKAPADRGEPETTERPAAAPAVRRRLARGLSAARTAVVAAPVAVVGLALLVDVAAALVPTTRSQVWYVGYFAAALPVWFTGVLLLAAVPAVLRLADLIRVRGAVVDGALVVVFAAYCFGTRVVQQTGDQPAWQANAATPDVGLSEPLAELVHKAAFHLGGSSAAVGYVSPVFGVLVAIAYLWMARELADGDKQMRTGLRLLFFATCIPWFFIVGYVENTYLALPALFVAIALILRRSRARTGRGLVLGAAAAMAVAVLFHGSMLVLAAAGLAFLVSSGRFTPRDLGAVAIGFAAPVGALLLLLRLSPLTATAGNAAGGGDGRMFVPVLPTPEMATGTTALLTAPHALQVANILLFASPLLVPVLPLAAVRLVRRRRTVLEVQPRAAETGPVLLLAWMALAYIVYVTIWGFDLGTWGDLDLMTVPGLPLALFAFVVVARALRSRPQLLHLLVYASAVVTITQYAFRATTSWS